MKSATTDKLAVLVQKRDSFMAEKNRKSASATKSSFDSVVENTLRSQLKS